VSELPTTPPGEVTPIFIIGLPRSGSTLTDQILAAHPLIDSVCENGFQQDASRVSQLQEHMEARIQDPAVRTMKESLFFDP
jgi:hypothetical protein